MALLCDTPIFNSFSELRKISILCTYRENAAAGAFLFFQKGLNTDKKKLNASSHNTTNEQREMLEIARLFSRKCRRLFLLKSIAKP